MHELLLELAGWVDDDLLGWARELVAVGEDDQAVELIVGTLLADRLALPARVRDAVVAVAHGSGVEPDPDGALELPSGGTAPEHRFGPTDAGLPGFDDALAEVAGRMVPHSQVWRAWRLTPSGGCPGPVPHPVVLVELGPGGGLAPDVVAYRVCDALRRAGYPASVEVFGPSTAVPDYHQAAMRDAVAVTGAPAAAPALQPVAQPAAAPVAPRAVPPPVAEPVPEPPPEPAWEPALEPVPQPAWQPPPLPEPVPAPWDDDYLARGPHDAAAAPAPIMPDLPDPWTAPVPVPTEPRHVDPDPLNGPLPAVALGPAPQAPRTDPDQSTPPEPFPPLDLPDGLGAVPHPAELLAPEPPRPPWAGARPNGGGSPQHRQVDALAGLTDTERSLLRQLHEELVAREARLRAGRSAGMANLNGGSRPHRHNRPEPPDIAS